MSFSSRTRQFESGPQPARRAVRFTILCSIILLILPLACGRDEEDVEPEAARPAALPPPDSETWREVQAELTPLLTQVDARLRRVPDLTRAERGRLRRDRNAIQLRRARRLGVPPGTPVARATDAGRLVQLPDTTEYWTLRELVYSEPFVTPATLALLVEIAQRFQARLDSLGLPRYRLDITSVLRTPEKQAALRRSNPNAARTESAHEFGTTVDIAYRRFAPPADYPGRPEADDEVERLIADSLMVAAAGERAAEMQAVLGRVLLELQREGKVLVMMERRQTVYHITVGRRLQLVRRRAA